jgi:uncharacterized protein (TIGR02001 family)
MKKSLLNIALTSLLATSTFISTQASATGIEGLTTNVGVVSQYIFRGVSQTDNASASAGVDYENGDFSVGTWIADVGDGLEVDLYGSYGVELDNGLGLSAGFTTYQYTGDFDTQYNEVNLGASYDYFTIGYNIGTWEVEGGPDQDYTFLSITAEYEGFYATYGNWGDDLDGDYVEFGYGTDVSGFDVGVSLVINSKELGHADEALVFSLAKSF